MRDLERTLGSDMKERVRVILVDDHEIVRLGLKTLLGDIPWIEVVAEVGTAGVEGRSIRLTASADRLPGESGIEACQKIVDRWPNLKVIMLTSFEQDDLVFKALQAGAAGYVLKQVGNQPLIDALDAVRQGNALLDPSVTMRLIQGRRLPGIIPERIIDSSRSGPRQI